MQPLEAAEQDRQEWRAFAAVGDALQELKRRVVQITVSEAEQTHYGHIDANVEF